MTNTHHTTRMVVLSALFAALSVGFLQEVSSFESPDLLARILPRTIGTSGRAISSSLKTPEKVLTTAEKRRRSRVANQKSGAPIPSVSTFGFRSVQTRSRSSIPTFTLQPRTGTTDSLKKAGCGDKLIIGSEQCDDGNAHSGDGCTSACAIEIGFTCTSAQPSQCWSECGDGVQAATEKCDDGNESNGDGCTTSCIVEVGSTCTGSPSVCTIAAYCGDEVMAGSEACDDGNNRDGDGCSHNCAVETGYSCQTGSPSVCRVDE